MGAPGATEGNKPGKNRTGFENFFPVRSQSCAASMKATMPMWLLIFILIKTNYNEIISILVPLATFQLLDSHKWLVATTPDGADTERFHHRRKLYWPVLPQSGGVPPVTCPQRISKVPLLLPITQAMLICWGQYVSNTLSTRPASPTLSPGL